MKLLGINNLKKQNGIRKKSKKSNTKSKLIKKYNKNKVNKLKIIKGGDRTEYEDYIFHLLRDVLSDYKNTKTKVVNNENWENFINSIRKYVFGHTNKTQEDTTEIINSINSIFGNKLEILMVRNEQQLLQQYIDLINNVSNLKNFNDIIYYLFLIFMTKKTECSCGHKQEITDPALIFRMIFWDKKFFKSINEDQSETPKGYICDKCNNKGTTIKYNSYTYYGNYILINYVPYGDRKQNISSFSGKVTQFFTNKHDMVKYKKTHKFNIEEQITVNSGENSRKYNLISISVHIGNTLKRGHYTNFKRDLNNMNIWYYCDDGSISKPINFEEVKKYFTDWKHFSPVSLMYEIDDSNKSLLYDKSNDEQKRKFDNLFTSYSNEYLKPKGFKNHTNDCFIIAFMQLLFNNRHLVKYIGAGSDQPAEATAEATAEEAAAKEREEAAKTAAEKKAAAIKEITKAADEEINKNVKKINDLKTKTMKQGELDELYKTTNKRIEELIKEISASLRLSSST